MTFFYRKEDILKYVFIYSTKTDWFKQEFFKTSAGERKYSTYSLEWDESEKKL